MLKRNGQNKLLVYDITSAEAEFVKTLYAKFDRIIAGARPKCTNCKACCDFGKTGHRLFVTNLELAYFAANVDQVKRPIGMICPYLDAEIGCTVRRFRPIGCRTYFCSPPKHYSAADLTEQALGEIKSFVEQEQLPYQYCEWLGALDQLAGQVDRRLS